VPTLIAPKRQKPLGHGHPLDIIRKRLRFASIHMHHPDYFNQWVEQLLWEKVPLAVTLPKSRILYPALKHLTLLMRDYPAHELILAEALQSQRALLRLAALWICTYLNNLAMTEKLFNNGNPFCQWVMLLWSTDQDHKRWHLHQLNILNHIQTQYAVSFFKDVFHPCILGKPRFRLSPEELVLGSRLLVQGLLKQEYTLSNRDLHAWTFYLQNSIKTG
jgi:hypothetical protein